MPIPSFATTKGVSTRKHKRALLHGVDIELQTGAILGLLGRSGSGKSTLLKVLSQNYQPNLNILMDQSGESQLSSKTKAYLCQEDPVLAFGNLYPVDYLDLTSKLYNADPGKVWQLYGFTKELLSRGGQQVHQEAASEGTKHLDPFFETRIKNLSGGQRRILSIAATFLCQPQVLMLDEPCSGLDSISSLQVMSALQSFTELGQCASIVTYHQPSVDIISQFTKIVVLDAGKVVFNEPVVDPESIAYAVDRHLLNSHEKSQRVSEREGSSRNLLISVLDSSSTLTQSSRRMTIQPLGGIEESIDESGSEGGLSEGQSASADSGTLPAGGDVVDWSGKVRSMNAQILEILRQVRPLSQRMYCQNGYEITDGATIVAAFSVLAGVLLVEDGSHIQIVKAAAVMIGVPSFLFTHKVFAYNELRQSHKFEMHDKRISPLSFQISTSLFTFPDPLLFVLLAQTVAYAIIGWSFSTFAVQFVFVGVYLLVALQFGRVLCVALGGHFGAVMKVYTTVLLINAVFSGVFVTSNQLPDALFYMSITFWALSGSVLNIFEDGSYSENMKCLDLISCVLSDGNAVGRVLGFSPMSNSYRALAVLSIVFACLVVMEGLLLHACCVGTRSTSLFRKNKQNHVAHNAENYNSEVGVIEVSA